MELLTQLEPFEGLAGDAGDDLEIPVEVQPSDR